MKTQLSIFFIGLILLVVPSQRVYGQVAGGHVTIEKCRVCGKLKQNCPYKGRHPRQTSETVSTPATGTLLITSTPSRAFVRVDGETVGITPLTLNYQRVGTCQVTFSADGYETVTKSVTVSAGKTATCNATLNEAAQQSTATTAVSYETFTANGISFNMVLVDGGTFMMGATSEQGKDASYDEKPAHQVTLSAYHIGETEVTQELWEAVMGSNPSNFKGANRPVETVSWDDCQTFISKLNALTGKNFRLPTEAEWEFAARGGNKSNRFKYSGKNTLGNVAWFRDNSAKETHPVMTKSANELGLFDMSGNVWEWCQDWYGDYESSSQTNPTGPSTGSYRVSRGGGWLNFARRCRVLFRAYGVPDSKGFNLGLRLAL